MLKQVEEKFGCISIKNQFLVSSLNAIKLLRILQRIEYSESMLDVPHLVFDLRRVEIAQKSLP
jgi:hypothetical protein